MPDEAGEERKRVKMELCSLCASWLREEGKSVKMLTGKSEWITCDGCGRRRLGVTYDVVSGGRKEKKKG